MTKKKNPQFYSDYDQQIDSETFVDSVREHFSNVQDPRISANQAYPLTALLVMILGAILAGANSISAIYNYSRIKFSIFQRLFEIEKPPSYCVFWWLLVRLDPSQLEEAFFLWVKLLPDEVKKRVIAIDGKKLNGTKQQQVHLVSAWDTERGLLIGQVKAEQKSNEITAIPELLKVIDVKDAIVTIDAAGCQKKIVEDIVAREGDYVIALKGNQGTLYTQAENFFAQAREIGHADMGCLVEKMVEKGHGRLERREVVVSQDLGWLEGQSDWAKLKIIIEVTATREIQEKVTQEKRYYIASLDLTPKRSGNLVRGHWGIENHLHWSLDVVFREDDCIVNIGHAPENLALFRRIGHSLIQKDVGGTKGIAEKRRQAGWDDAYMLHLLGVLIKHAV